MKLRSVDAHISMCEIGNTKFSAWFVRMFSSDNSTRGSNHIIKYTAVNTAKINDPYSKHADKTIVK